MRKRGRQTPDHESGGDTTPPCSLTWEDPVMIPPTPRASTSLSYLSSSGLASPPSGKSPTKAHMSFGAYVWNEVSIVLFFRFTLELRKMCVALLRIVASLVEESEPCSASLSPAVRSLFCSLERNLQVAWDVGKRHLSSEERCRHDVVIQQYVRKFVLSLQTTLKDTTDMLTTFRQLQRFFEEEGYPLEETGELSDTLVEYRQEREVNGYSYHVRSSMQLPLLPRYEGDRKLEEERSRPRVGYIVVLPRHHPNANVNTVVQLIEPKKKRAPLDEYRIFSHPKKASTYGVEDFLVDEELTYRAIIVLRYHLDTYGSLVDLSPYARFLLWNLLGCDDEAFERVYNQPATTPQVQAELVKLRKTIAIKQAVFEGTRAAAREAALHIGWCAISAQWRDQVLCSLSEASEGNWYALGDISFQGGRAVFPNYASNALVCELALGVLEKVSAIDGSAALLKDGPSPAIILHTVRAALLPFLQGAAPLLSLDKLATSPLGQHFDCGNETACHCSKRLQQVLAGKNEPSGSASNGSAQRRFAFISLSMLFPLQCLAELLDLCSLAYFSKEGLRAFSTSLLSSSWACEEDLIRFLIETEAMNPAIAPIAALLRLCRKMFAGVQKMLQDKFLLYVLAVRLEAESCAVINLGRRDYSYWKALVTISEDGEDYSDSVLLLEVETLESAPPLKTISTNRYYTQAYLEKPPRVWNEDLEDLLKEEELYKKTHPVKPKGED